MNRIFSIIVLLSIVSQPLVAQKYFTRNGQVSFHSRAMLEDIDAYNNQGTFVMDVASKKIQMAVLIKAFQFEKALMQEHFNENYMESDQYPKAEFKGDMISNYPLDFTEDSKFPPVKINGQLTIRGITRDVSTEAHFKVENGEIHGSAVFPVKVDDFNIKIPGIVKDKIAREIEVRVKVQLKKL